MGLLNIFKKVNKPEGNSTNNGVLGPTYLDSFTGHIQNPKDLHSHEWRRQIKTTSGQTKFKIKYYGQLHNDYNNLIVETDLAPSLVFAVDIITRHEILLFDGCKHGYNSMFCDTFTEEQIENRLAETYYKDQSGNDIFEITISTYNGIDYDDEFSDEVDDNGLIELVNGTKTEFEIVKRNGFDTLQIWLTNDNGETINIISEELA